MLLIGLAGCVAPWLTVALSIPAAAITTVICVTLLFACALVLTRRWQRCQAQLAYEQERLAHELTEYRQRFECNAGAMLVYDLATWTIRDANPAAEALLGWSRQELGGMTIGQLIPPGSEELLRRHMAQIVARPDSEQHLSTDLQRRDGSIHPAELWGSRLALDGRAARLVNMIDRSAEVATRRQLDTALNRMREVQSIARIGALEIDPVKAQIRLSDEACLLLARRPGPSPTWQPIGDAFRIGENDASELLQSIDAIVKGSAAQLDLLLRVRAMDGRLLTIHLRARLAPVQTGAAPGVIHGTLQDVSEREHSRQLLKEREEQFRELVRVLPDGVVILSEDQVLYINPLGAAQFGYAAEQMLGTPLQSLVTGDDLARVRDYLNLPRRYLDRLPPLIPSMQRQDGSHFLAALSVGDVRYGGRDCRLLVIRDLTELESHRAALETSNRELQALAGRLFSVQEDERRAISRDLHDDIGQSITAIKLAAHAAMHELDATRRNEDIGQIIELVDSTVTRLRNLSMLLRPPQLDALGLQAAVRWQAGQLFRASPVELQMEIGELSQRPDNAIEQACFRIAQESLTNALRHAQASQVQLRLNEAENGQLHLRVIDDGEGFDPDGPRGLGLIVMRERAQSAGGKVEIITAPGEGTCIDLYLPIRASQPLEAAAGL
ncbi:PAS domain-containing sensor histidine kinase [Stenotrophomonas pictorum]|uniref:PAS domain-containing sensor histidine kinase n=1 Tax=Stenotrophomonas pictorum TaxID=86184 RepID=UPI00070C4F69|nr:PAS domain-containing sensor histidine kinase [Stenotrophomonas pictorum]